MDAYDDLIKIMRRSDGNMNAYEHLIERIRERRINIPEDMTAEKLEGWLAGYVKCQNFVIELLEDFSEPQR